MLDRKRLDGLCSIIKSAWSTAVFLLLIKCHATVEAQVQEHADLVIRGGRVVTVDATLPEAESVAIAGDRILAVGTEAEIGRFVGDRTRTIRLNGQLVIPGFIEGHGHFLSLGQSKQMLDLTKARSWDDIVEQVKQAVQKTSPGQWIVGRGWHQEKWDTPPTDHVDGYPTAKEVSRVSPEHPVMLTHASGHMCFANDLAMRLAGITAATEPPSGGEILRDDSGRAIGIFREKAQGLITREWSRQSQSLSKNRQSFLQAVDLATRECHAKGVTSFQDAGSSFDTIRMFRELAREGELGVRLWLMVRDSATLMESQLPRFRAVGESNHFFTVRGIKLSLDGALGSHGAWLLMPYEDLPQSVGLNTATIEVAKHIAELAVAHDYQFCIHAIGDRANREVLDLFEATFQAYPSESSRRWRVEHAQHLHPTDIPRFGELGVIASMQGIHCTSDAAFVLQRLGARRAQEGAYVWRKLLDAGAVVSNGTDAPVEDVDPIASFHATVTRELDNGVTFFPEQRLTRQEALESYTLSGAYAAFEEEIKGSITPGKLADLVVLSKDIMRCPAREIRDAQVEITIIGGKVVYQRPGSGHP